MMNEVLGVALAAVLLYAVVATLFIKGARKKIDGLRSELKGMKADVARKNAALITIADNAEKVRNEKNRIAKSDLDELIAHARELSDVVREELPTGDGRTPDSDTGVLPGTLVDPEG